MGIPFPKEYGGAGGNYLTYAMAVEELGKVCATTAVIVSAHTSLCAGPIYYFGTEEQKQKYLVPLANRCIRPDRAQCRYRLLHAADNSCSGW